MLLLRHSSRTRLLNDSIAVAPRLAGWDEVQADAFAGPVGHRGAGELGAVVAPQHSRIAPVDGKAVEFVDQVSSGDVALDQAAEAFTLDAGSTARRRRGVRG
jgi:hypothetical protein